VEAAVAADERRCRLSRPHGQVQWDLGCSTGGSTDDGGSYFKPYIKRMY
jgi:hypothetical protein